MEHSSSSEILAGLIEGRVEAWQRFTEHYRPLLISFGPRLGLNEPDAQDAAQETLVAFLGEWRKGSYDRSKGRLRQWLLGIARNKVLYLLRQRGRAVQPPELSGTGFLDRIPDDETMTRAWEAEEKQWLLARCIEEVRSQVEERTFRAFELVTLEGWPSERAAESLSMTVNALLKANRRVLTRMREIQRRWEQEG